MIFVKLDNKNRVRILEFTIDNNLVYRKSALFGKGFTTYEPKEDSEDNIIKYYRSRGYLSLEDIGITDYETYTEEQVAEKIKAVTGKIQKMIPMGMKNISRTASKFMERTWYVSPNINGLRVLVYYEDSVMQIMDEDGNLLEQDNLNVIKNDTNLNYYFTIHPNYIIDGYIYKEGYSKELILEQLNNTNSNLQLWIQDLIPEDINVPFSTRLDELYELMRWLDIHNFNSFSNEPIKILPHIESEGFMKINTQCNKYTLQGYDGIVVINPDKGYKFNYRDNRMLVFDKYIKSDYKIEDVNEHRKAFICRDKKNGNFFEVSYPYSYCLKDAFSLDNIGKTITIKYLSMRDKYEPKDPIFHKFKK